MIDLSIFNARHLIAAIEKERADFERYASAGNLYMAIVSHKEVMRIEAELRARCEPQNITPRPLKIAGS